MSTPTPFSLANELHPNPAQPPQFAVSVKNSAAQDVSLACPRATRALVALMDMEAVIGGAASHFGGPAAFAEMMSATHGFMFEYAHSQGKQWHECFYFVNDAGHCENGLYALKANYQAAGLKLESLKSFRSMESPLTGHGEAHLFPEGVFISNGPLGSGLPQAQGLAAAESLRSNGKVTIAAISDGACMEGEAKEALAAIPGLAQNGRLGPFLCMVSDNNTKLSGRIDDDSYSMQPTFKSLQDLGWEVTFVEDGHDLQGVYQTIEKSVEKLQKDAKRSQLLWVRTIKGKGVKTTEDSASGGHGFPIKKPQDVMAFVKEIYQGGELPSPIEKWADQLAGYEKAEDSAPPRFAGERMKVQVGISEALIEKYQGGLPIVSVSADLQGSTGVAGFRKKFPEACFEVGVAESNMVNMAVGLSKGGYIPIVDTFSQFAVTKGALPLIMSGLSQGPMIGIFSHTGFQDAADGASHQALTYFAMTSSIPYVDVHVLSCRQEAYQLLGQALEKFAEDRKAGKVPRSQIFFLGRENYQDKYGDVEKFELGKAQVVSRAMKGYSQSVSLIACGPMLEHALLAQQALEGKGIGSIVIHPSAVNHPDLETIEQCLAETGGYCVTVEDHREIGGFGSRLAHALVDKGVAVKMRTLGVGDHFGRSAYEAKQLYDKYGLGVMDIVEATESLF